MAGLRIAAATTAAAAALLSAACSIDPYPLISPHGARSWYPTPIGRPVPVVVLYLQPNPGDRIELISAEPVGVAQGADVRLWFSPPIIEDDGSRLIGRNLQPIAGAVAFAPAGAPPGPEHAVGIVAEITPRQAGTWTLTGVRLRFRLNGGPDQTKEGISEITTICAALPMPTCDPDS